MAKLIERKPSGKSSKWQQVADQAMLSPTAYHMDGVSGLSLTFRGCGGRYDAQPSHDVFLTPDDIEEILRAAEKFGLLPKLYVKSAA